jgi:enamine deaminase RidA (YjgF/YER057c/UK114 family)
LLAVATAWVGDQVTKEHLNPSDLPNWADSFSQVVVVQTGATRTIYVAGQVAVDADYNVIGRGDLGRQVEVAVGNLTRALAAAGARPADVVRLGIYVKDYRRDQAGLIRAALGRVFVPGRMPTSTWLGVESLALDDLLFEIEATAVVEAEPVG